jgi:hypothetical protein
VVIWELSGDTLSVGYVDGEDGPQMRGLRVGIGEGIAGTAVSQQQMIVTADAHLDSPDVGSLGRNQELKRSSAFR